MSWSLMLRAAAERFGIAPAAFWRLSLKEWRALTEPVAAAALDRNGLERLMGRWPDEGAEARR